MRKVTGTERAGKGVGTKDSVRRPGLRGLTGPVNAVARSVLHEPSGRFCHRQTCAQGALKEKLKVKGAAFSVWENSRYER